MLYFLRLGCLGFGGPVALVGQMERELVADRVAEQVHDCLGRLLANVVVEGAKLTNAEKKEIR